MNEKDLKIYKSLSNDPNKRGRLWKEYKTKRKESDIKESDGINVVMYKMGRDLTVELCAMMGAKREYVEREYNRTFMENLRKYETNK